MRFKVDQISLGRNWFALIKGWRRRFWPGALHRYPLAAQMRAGGYNTETCAIAEAYLSRFG